jgi:beta-glucosidase
MSLISSAGFSVDPYLAGSLVSETVTAIQGVGVITSTKVRRTQFVETGKAQLTTFLQHYIANEQETNRSPENGLEAVSSNIDDQTMHELYLW